MAIYRKPAAIAEIVQDKAIGAQSNLAATLNWIISCLCNLKYKTGGSTDDDKIEGLENGVPVLDRGGGEPLTVVVGVEYDPSTHKLQCKTRKVKAVFADDDIGGYEIVDVFEAVPHDTEAN